MADGSVSDGEFSKVESYHFRLNVNQVEHLAVVDSSSGANHFRDDDHVSEVSLDDSRFLERTSG